VEVETSNLAHTLFIAILSLQTKNHPENGVITSRDPF